MKMVSLKKPKAASGKNDVPMVSEGHMSYPEDEGVALHLDHHHLTKMGVGGNLKSGDKVEFGGEGRVERSETITDKDGERHSATIRLHKGGVDHEPSMRDGDEERTSLRGDLEKNYAGTEGKK